VIRSVFLMLLWIALVEPSTVRADVAAGSAATQEELAKSLFAEGVKLSEELHWVDAAERFERSLQLFPRSRTALNLAVALMRAGQPVAAVAALDKYSALASDAPREEREAADRLRDQVESMTAHLSLEVFPVETELSVDERPLPHLAKQWLVLNPGRHDVQARYRGELRTLTVELKAGERVTHEIRWPHPEATPLPSPSEAAHTLPPDKPVLPSSDAAPRTWKRWVWIGSAALVAVGAAAVTTWALRRDSGSSAACPAEEVCIH
jgi:hypothetical protein